MESKERVIVAKKSEGGVFINYYDDPSSIRHRGWTISKAVVDELFEWWSKKRKRKKISFPLIKKMKSCNVLMASSKSVNVQRFNMYGKKEICGYDLPIEVVDAMVDYCEKNKKD